VILNRTSEILKRVVSEIKEVWLRLKIC